MLNRLLTAAAVLATLASSPSPAQILRDLEPIELEYEIYIPGEPEPAGTASASFRPADTRRGRRLEVTVRTDFKVGDPETAVEYHETVSLTCNEHGVEKFDALRRFGDNEEKYLGIKTAEDYAVTATVNGEATQKTETGEVLRSNFGLFCGGFLETPMDEGGIIVDYPLLFPAQGRHFPRQKVRVGWINVGNADPPIDVIHSRLRKLDGNKDELWHLDDDHQALVRMVETGDIATLVYSLVALNGEDVSGWSRAIADAFPQ
ncbi:MAG TPA: hypothetical protein VKU85_17425 [bacterium]|nr:hypothetical protein [bacterium]